MFISQVLPINPEQMSILVYPLLGDAFPGTCDLYTGGTHDWMKEAMEAQGPTYWFMRHPE